MKEQLVTVVTYDKDGKRSEAIKKVFFKTDGIVTYNNKKYIIETGACKSGKCGIKPN